MALAVVVAAGIFIVVIRACTFARGIGVGDGVVWEATRRTFRGVEPVCFFGLKLLEVFDVEDFVEGVRVVGLVGFWVRCECFDWESLGGGDGVLVRSGAFEGVRVMLEVSRESWCFFERWCCLQRRYFFERRCFFERCCSFKRCWLFPDRGFSPRYCRCW